MYRSTSKRRYSMDICSIVDLTLVLNPNFCVESKSAVQNVDTLLGSVVSNDFRNIVSLIYKFNFSMSLVSPFLESC